MALRPEGFPLACGSQNLATLKPVPPLQVGAVWEPVDAPREDVATATLPNFNECFMGF